MVVLGLEFPIPKLMLNCPQFSIVILSLCVSKSFNVPLNCISPVKFDHSGLAPFLKSLFSIEKISSESWKDIPALISDEATFGNSELTLLAAQSSKDKTKSQIS